MGGVFGGGAPGAGSFLPDSYTVSTLPDPATAIDRYAIVTDLYGSVRDVVKAFSANGVAYWRPVAPYTKTYAVQAGLGTLTIQPLLMPSGLFMTGTLTANLLVSISTARAWPGQEQFVGFDGALGLFGITLQGFGALLNAGRRRFIFDGAAWQQG